MNPSQPSQSDMKTHNTVFVDLKQHRESPHGTDKAPPEAPSKERQTAYQPSTGTDPSGRMGHEQRIKEVKREMTGHWVEGDDDLLDSFFPPGSVSPDDIKHIKRELYDSKRKRWKGIPKTLTDEKVLVKAIHKILQTIHRHGNVGSDYDILDTRKARIFTHDGSTLAPDLFISLLHELISGTNVHETTPTSFQQCLAFLEAKLHSNRHPTETAIQVATYVREILMAQSNRGFVPAFSITERIMKFSMFDRSGAQRSSHFDYHKHPDRFCEIFLSLLQRKPESLGFDKTVFYKTPSMQCIKVIERSGTDEQKDVNYIVEALLMRSYTIVGAGTTYWRVRREGDSKSSESYIIQDSWLPRDMEDEQALIRNAGNDYVAPLVHTEVVRSYTGGPDTTVRNRLTRYAASKTVDRIHTRSIYKSSGRLLEQFQNPMEILVSFHHAITAHGLLLKQGVIYPDIVPWNILIPSQTQSGALIDMDRAMRKDSSTPRGAPTPGSWLFLPRKTLEGSTSTSHMDDLETFFHIFCFIVVGHRGPQPRSSRIQDSHDLESYGGSLDIAITAKSYLIESDTFKYTVQTEYFKDPTAQLAVDLHYFFHSRWKSARDATLAGEVLPSPDPVEDYREFTTHIRDAIHQLAILCGKLKSLDRGSEASPGNNSLDVGYGRIEELLDATAATAGRKRSLSTALGTRRRSSSRLRKRARE